MKKILLSIAILVATISQAFALADAAVPTKIPTPWGQSAPGGNITCPMPIPSQISISAGRASWTDGFPPLTFLSLAGGGVPPAGQDFNGVLCQISQWTRWSIAGAPIFYDATFQSAIGGYPNGTMLQSNVNPYHLWVSTVDNNASNPESGGANWTDVYLLALGSSWGATSGGSANVQTITIPGWTSNLVGVPIQFIPGFANTSAATLQINAATPVAVKKKTLQGLQVLTGGELQLGQIASVTFDGTIFELQQQTSVRLNLVQITATVTYTPSTGITSADVTCVGGGGGGGGSAATGASQGTSGGGGGGGGIGEGIFTAAQLLPNVSVTIGAGGAGNIGAAGSVGGTTIFGGLITAGGGAPGATTGVVGGSSAAGTAIASGGSTTVGPIKTQGGTATPGQVVNFGGVSVLVTSGSGGPGLFGGGAAGTNLTSGATNGVAAANNGAGGSGGASGPSQVATIGGAGAAGICIVKELIAQ